MTAETRMRAINEVVMATGGHDATSLSDELMDVTHKPVLQTPTDTLLIDIHTHIL